MTRTQAVMGSPGYMSPEQMRSTKNVDGRSDIWSLGVILYELVAGRTPFQADTFSALCVKIAVDPHPPMLALPAKLPAGFEAVVNRALEKDPALRYRSAAELAQALAPYAGASARERAQRLVAASPGAMPSAAHQVMLGPNANTIDAASGQALSGSRRRGRWRARRIAGAGLAAAAVIGVAIGAARSGGGGGRGATGVEPRAALPREPLPPDARSEPIAAPPSPDAGVDSAAPPSSPPASTAPGAPAPAAPPAPPVPRPGAGAAAPAVAAPAPAAAAPAAPGKPRPKPPTVDPYSSPD
jgi:serine/threonine-protein kinase